MGTLYEQIDGLCAARGISVGKMCADTALSRGNLTDLKMGRIKSLSAEALNKIARYFGVTVDFMLTGQNPPAAGDVGFDDFTYALWQETQQLSQTQKEALLGMARFFKSELDKEEPKREEPENEQAKEAAD